MSVEELTKIHKVLGAGLVTNDGIVIESRVMFDYDAEKLGSMASGIINKIKDSLGIGKGSIILHTFNIVFFAKETERGIFFVICQRDANIGLIKLKIDKIK